MSKHVDRSLFIRSGVIEREEKINSVKEEENTAQAPAGRKSRFTFNLPDSLMEKARAAVYYTPGQNLSLLVTQALEAELRRLERARGHATTSL